MNSKEVAVPRLRAVTEASVAMVTRPPGTHFRSGAGQP